VQLLTRNGYDWADRYPLIVEAALRNRTTSFVIDGEGPAQRRGVSDFNELHSRRHNDEVQPDALEILSLDGEDLRNQPLHLRKSNPARPLHGGRKASSSASSSAARSARSIPAGLQVWPRRPDLEAQGPAGPRRAEIHDAVMAFPRQKRRDRAKVNEAVRDGVGLGPLRPAGYWFSEAVLLDFHKMAVTLSVL